VSGGAFDQLRQARSVNADGGFMLVLNGGESAFRARQPESWPCTVRVLRQHGESTKDSITWRSSGRSPKALPYEVTTSMSHYYAIQAMWHPAAIAGQNWTRQSAIIDPRQAGRRLWGGEVARRLL